MQPITIETEIFAPVKKVWDYMNEPAHITGWNFAHESWHCPSAENELRLGGALKTRMEARDGSAGFDLVGIYDEIIPYRLLKYHLEDGRKVEVRFEKTGEATTKVAQVFEPESAHARDLQQEGWSSILNNFRKYTQEH